MKTKMVKLVNRHMLKDAMYNLRVESGATDEYARGILVGAVSALMATGMTFEQATAECRKSFPDMEPVREQCVPGHWRSALLG